MNEASSNPAGNLRVAYLAAGAAGMYCGSCIRDNRVASTLIEAGKDVILIPLYTPLRTDEADVSEHTVYYGGINVYLEQRFRLFRHIPRAIVRLLDAPGLIRRTMRLSSNVRAEDLGPMTVSVLQGEHGAQRVELERLIEALGRLKPNLVHLPNLPFLGAAVEIKERLGVPILCTLSGEDIFLDQLPNPHRSQAFDLIRTHAAKVDAFVAVTDYYADFAAKHFSLPRDRIHVVRMGIRTDDFADPANPPDQPFTIGYLARICPEKGLAALAEAFILLRKQGRDCRLIAAGNLGKADRPYLEGVEKRLRQAAVAEHFRYLGEVTREEKVGMLQSLHVLSVPAVYHESKGLYILEALAAGVPVVQPSYGSFPELITATNGGLLYEGEGKSAPQALADAIGKLMDNPDLRAQHATDGRNAVRELFTDTVMADQTWALYDRVCSGLSSTPFVESKS